MTTMRKNGMDGGAWMLLFALFSIVLHALSLWAFSHLGVLRLIPSPDAKREKAVEVEVVPMRRSEVKAPEPAPRPVVDEARVIKLSDDAREKNERPQKTTLYAERSRRVDVEELPEPSPAPERSPATVKDDALPAQEAAPQAAQAQTGADVKLPPYEGDRVSPGKDGKEAAGIDRVESSTKTVKAKTPSGQSLYPDKRKLLAISRTHELKEGQNVVSSTVKTGKVAKLNTTEFEFEPYSINSVVRLGNGEIKDDQYSLHILNRVRRELYYPPASAQNFEQGTVVVRFFILKDGSVDPDDVSLYKSSGYPMLDDALVTSIRLSSRFNPIPERLKKDHVPVEFTVEYILR